MTGMTRASLQLSYFTKGLLLAVFAALFGSILLSHQAAAGGPIMTGKTYVQGVDRFTGTTYRDPRYDGAAYPRIIGVYPGDQVTFRYNIINWDPIPFISGNVAIEYHSVDLVGNDTKIFSEPSRAFFNIIPLLPSGYWYRQASTVTISGPGSDTPGKQFCEYVQTNPTVYDYLDPTAFFTGGVVVGLHKFNTNPDHIAIPLPLVTQLGGSFYLGNVMSCAEIAYDYNLMPSITLNNPGDVRSGGPVSVNPAIKQGPLPGPSATDSQLAEWQITQVIIKDGNKPNPNGGTSSQDPCNTTSGYFKPAQGSCTVVARSSTTVTDRHNTTSTIYKDTIFGSDGSIKPSGAALLASLPASGGYVITNPGQDAFPTSLPSPGVLADGDIVCYALSVRAYAPYLTDSVTWRHSALTCPPNLQKPKLHILSDDLRAGGRIVTAQAGLTTVFGSWAAYASYSGGATTSFATGASLKDGKPSAGLTQLSINPLTFANTQTTFGSFAGADTVLGNAGTIKGYFDTRKPATSDLAPTPAAGPGTSLDNLAGRTQPYYVSGPLTIEASTIAKGKTLIIVANDTIKIAGDIHYTDDSLGSLNDIPQVVLVAPRITINGNVGQVDAWLVTDLTTGASKDATKYFVNTCTEGGIAPRSLTFNAAPACKNHLTINGPVITSHLYPNRTAGDDSSDDTAETFASNGDAYLWARNYANTNLGLTTTRQTEQPVRY